MRQHTKKQDNTEKTRFSGAGEHITDILYFIAGGFIFSCGIVFFALPNGIAPGGLTGVALILNHLFGLPTGTTVFMLNIPLFILSAKALGGRFLYKTIVATLICSALLDIVVLIPFSYDHDPLLASLYAGVMSGVGLAIVFLRGGTTGGTDIGARLINKAFPRFSVGTAILLIDAVVVAASGIVFSSYDSALYAVITIFVTSRVIDYIIYGALRGRLLFIMTKQSEKTASRIMNEIGRGVTLLDSHGGYTNNSFHTILCAVSMSEAARVKKLVSETDPESFIITGEASDITGLGFKNPDSM